MEELDYRHEAARQEAFAQMFEGHERVRIPRVVKEMSATRVLTTDLAEGLRFEEACARGERDRMAWAETLTMFVFGGLLGHGLFNADPHPGNYIFIAGEDGGGESEGTAGAAWFLDFGCTRALSPENLRRVRNAHRLAVIDHDGDALAEAFAEMLDIPKGGEHARLGREYIKLCFEPLLARGPYRITREYTTRLYTDMRDNAKLMLRGSRKNFAPLPAEWLFFNRLQLGFYSVLARLDVAVDYNAVDRGILEAIDARSGGGSTSNP
jgi:predicted unusual protein kinase regulating ubiquinone biosynthesis (AarF/ABC1/UbiB family)